jgi:hypothetical protein
MVNDMGKSLALLRVRFGPGHYLASACCKLRQFCRAFVS